MSSSLAGRSPFHSQGGGRRASSRLWGHCALLQDAHRAADLEQKGPRESKVMWDVSQPTRHRSSSLRASNRL